MPRAPWRRRRTTESPRPAYRWTGRLRRGGSVARRLGGRIIRRRGPLGTTTLLPEARPDFADLAALTAVGGIVPVSPAVPAPPGSAPTGPMTIPLLPGERTAVRQLKFSLVNACTLGSLTLGITAIFLAMQADVRWAAVCLIACVVFDGLDGALARRLGVASPFGAQMDSLADMCSFGLAAPVVVYASLAGTVPAGAAGVACALVAGCAAIRLARFNVSPKDGRFFCGVPTTMAAAVLALAVLIGLPISGAWQLAGVALLAFAMVSSFPYAKLARLVKLPPWLLAVPVLGTLVDIRLTFGLIVAAYLASGPLLWLRQRGALRPGA
ncbi:MAG TPA: CDP-alcohol phosphatidyltransferase family protein [Micromonosporaceae bacterium]|nr:CDP-alcohol phosphatidyltransferase family protein [Micromonosporaceae bacterium]